MSSQTKYLLDESKLPKFWYNINADMPVPPEPVLHPGTLEPVTPDFLSVLFPMPLIMQEISTERYIEIPEEVREVYKLWRPTPFIRARRLEKALDTPAHLYFKYEGVSPTGSHKPNTSVPQAFYNKISGTKALTTETGAGQWGSSLAFAGNIFDIDVEVYMVKVSYQQKPYRRIMMHTYGAEVYPSPTDRTNYGRSVLAEDPDSPGSLGIAISEAVEVAAMSNGEKKYSLGSVLNHVLMHQTVIGQEVLMQLEMADEYPDIIVGCTGGGSNFGGFAFPFLQENFRNGKNTRVIAAEPASCPTLTKGSYRFDYGDTAMMAPVVKMHTLGHSFVPPGIHAGGLRYHGMSPQVSALVHHGYVEPRAVHQLDTFKAGMMFAKAEGIIPAPEPTHAIAVAIEEALKCKASGEEKVIVFNMCGHGHFDMAAYDAYMKGELDDFEYPDEMIQQAIAGAPQVG
ncbi:MAG: TrpB-like pyridoxal phosphate-dependent enzyme [Anaerolineae bacterium]|nr:TrpB-like pyridoxal phosphate-dependent enzyme [Anaerolineae bacterium]MCO5190090.1 TrpB-like pyridoxal phosphate-dependent enzyme [Anaerolineae bacterium]MCO5196763.1 TrpB-like pyridoxal phosphate-dependent enzyme [Anaerolineae bacterium]MCO5205153.1 TrpB-like pyridoxal phosphate-dependent enzyme [Anaerolineae bacterium]